MVPARSWLLAVYLAGSDARLVIQGAGASLPAQLYHDAAQLYSAFPTSQADVAYTSMGSGRGQCRIKDWNATCSPGDLEEPRVVDFAGSDSLLLEEDYLAYPDLQLYPTVALAVVPVVNLPSLTPSDPALVLTPRVLADIFRSAITRWDDPQIAATNAVLAALGKLPPANIVLIVRSDNLGTTQLFKTALASFDPSGFGAQIGTSSQPVWPNATVVRCGRPPLDTASCVLSTPYSIGYTHLGEVNGLSLSAVSILKPGASLAVSATVDTINSALVEFSSAQLNGEELDSRLILSLVGGRCPAAWPISGVTYLVMHKVTSLFGGEDQCKRRLETVNFWHWFYTSSLARRLAAKEGFSVLPDELRSKVLRRLEADVLCGGSRVYKRVGADRVILGGGLGWMSPSMHWNGITYERGMPEYERMPSHEAVRRLLASTLHVAAVEKEHFLSSSAYDDSIAVIPHMGVPVALGFSFCGIAQVGCTLADRTLTWNMDVVAALLSGNLTLWLDPRLVALNPWMGTEPYASTIGATREIILIGVPADYDTSQIVLQLVRRHLPAANVDALLPSGRAVLVSDMRAVVPLLTATPFSIGFVPLVGVPAGHFSFASLTSPFDPSVLLPPSRLTAAACAPYAAPGARGQEFIFSASTAADCYPLTATVVLLMRREFNGTDCEQGGATVEFTEWATAAEGEQPEALNEVVFVSDKAPQLRGERLFMVSCDGESWLETHIERNYLGVLLVTMVWGVSLLLVGVLLAWLVWAIFHWRTTLKSSQPEFQLIILIGVALSIASGLVATRDHEEQVPDFSIPQGERGRYPDLDKTCVQQVWLYFLGNALIFGAMIAKLWRVTKLLVNPALRDIRVPLHVFLRYVGALVLLHVALLTAWTLQAPPYYRIEVFDRDDVHVWHGFCELLPEGARPFPLALLAIELALIQFGIYLCNRSRNVSPRYSEGKSIAFILWEFLQMTFIGLMVGALLYPVGPNGHPITFFVVKWMAPMSVNVTVTALMFVSKVVEWHNQHREPAHLAAPVGILDRPKRNSVGQLGVPSAQKCGTHEGSSCRVSARIGRPPHSPDGRARVSPAVSQRSDQSSKLSAWSHEHNALNSLVSQLQEAQEARRLAEDHLLDASADLTDLRERNHNLKTEKDLLVEEMRRLKPAAGEEDMGVGRDVPESNVPLPDPSAEWPCST